MKKTETIFLLTIVTAFLTGICFPSGIDAAADPFPMYRSIQPNVTFWKKVYAEFSSKQGILHDNRNLNIIYGVIDLRDPDGPGARKINRPRKKRAKEKYIVILKKLAQGRPPETKTEERVKALFGPGATRTTFREAANRVRCQVGQKDRFKKGLIRSGAFLKEIRGIFRKKGLPTDLAYLPHVESSFNPEAYSKFGAAGIWQFTRTTGKRFMTIDYVVDERRDPILASRAAAKLLKENYKKLGDWALALTAYNHGANGMVRAKRANGGYEAIFNKYRGRLFRFASRNFYSEFLAAREVAKNYPKHFGKLRLDRPVKSPVVILPGYVAMDDLVRSIGVEIADIRRLNLSLRGPVYRGEKYIPKGFCLRLPAGKGHALARAVSELSPDILKSRQKRSRFHRVRKGDTAGKIAKTHGIRLRDLIRANNLNARARIYAGQNLRLPVPGESIDRLASAEPPPKKSEIILPEETVSVSLAKAETPASTPALSPAPAPVPASEPVINPTVVTGDLEVKQVRTRKGIGVIRVAFEETIGHYADWLQVPAQEIRRLNGFRYGKTLRVNQRVKIPLDKISKERFEEKRFEHHEEIVQDFFHAYRVEQVQTYYIKRGDNIWRLCHEVFEVPLWLFHTYNAGLNLNALKASQPVRIPVIEKIASG